jgi:hypothetical protein
MKIEIDIETWPESAGRPELGPVNTAPPAEGQWRLLQVVLSEHDAGTEQVTNQVAKEGQQDA